MAVPARERVRRWGRRWLFVAVAYWASAQVGLSLALVGDQVTPLWPPTGIAVAALWCSKGRAWPGVLVGAFVVNAPLAPNLGTAVLIALGNTLAPYAAYRLLLRLDYRADLKRFRDALVLVLVAAMAAMTISATVGVGALTLAGPASTEGFSTAWWVWWTGDAMGVLVVAPLLLMLRTQGELRGLVRGRAVEVGLFTCAAGGLTVLVFGVVPVLSIFAVFPLLVWAAVRLQLAGAAPVAFVITVVGTASVARGDGPFEGLPVLDRMAGLQLFNASVAITAYLLAALTAERVVARVALVAAKQELESRVSARTAELSAAVARLERSEKRADEAQELAHIGSWEWDIGADEIAWSAELFRIFGREPSDQPMSYQDYLAVLHPDDREEADDVVQAAYAAREPFVVEHRVVHLDGSVHYVTGRGRVITDADGTPVRMVGTAQDVDDRRAAEELAAKLREASARRRQALELNDEVAQGLSVASMALSLGKIDDVRIAVSSTLGTVQGMITELWGEDAEGAELAAGDLRRERAADVSSPG